MKLHGLSLTEQHTVFKTAEEPETNPEHITKSKDNNLIFYMD